MSQFLIPVRNKQGFLLQILETFPTLSGKDASSENPISPDCPSECVKASSREDEPILYKLETAQDAQRKMDQNSDESLRRIEEFLEPQGEGGGGDMGQYLLPPKTLLRYALLMDIVRPTCRRSVCFTKGYDSPTWPSYNFYIRVVKTQACPGGGEECVLSGSCEYHPRSRKSVLCYKVIDFHMNFKVKRCEISQLQFRSSFLCK